MKWDPMWTLAERPAEQGSVNVSPLFWKEVSQAWGVAVCALIPSCGGEGDKDSRGDP